ncbi:MAG: hypothetical protein AB7U81_08695 [Thiohalomonadaceae bacterium]
MGEGPHHALNRRGYDAIAPQWDAARAVFSGRERAYVDVLLEGLDGGSDHPPFTDMQESLRIPAS